MHPIHEAMLDYTAHLRACSAREFGYHLGVSASHGDMIDYRAMLYRVRLRGSRSTPAGCVEVELRMGRTLTEHERVVAEKFGIAVEV